MIMLEIFCPPRVRAVWVSACAVPDVYATFGYPFRIRFTRPGSTSDRISLVVKATASRSAHGFTS